MPKQPSLKGLAMQAGSKARASRRRQKPTFELPWVYTQKLATKAKNGYK
jgi:hypothetical protein